MESLMSGKINLPDIRRIVAWASESEENRRRLMELAKSADRQTRVNAMWALTHMSEACADWLHSRRHELAGMLLAETDVAGKRLLLKLLREQDFGPDDIPTDLLDYCLARINSECEPYAIRASGIYLAFRMCRHYPELTAELKERLDMLGLQTLSPGLLSARRKTLEAIGRLSRK